MTDFLDQAPPQDLEAEKALLGSLLLDPECICETVQVVQPEDFYSMKHRHVYEAITTLFEKGRPIDLVTLRNALDEAGKLEDIGGVAVLMDAVEAVPSAANASSYADIIVVLSGKRTLLQAHYQGARDIMAGVKSIGDILRDTDAAVAQVSERTAQRDDGPISTVLTQVFEDVSKRSPGCSLGLGIGSGLLGLDEILAGFHKGEMVVIAARPSVGKTALALNCALHAAKQGKRILIFSLEMSAAALAERLLATHGKINAGKMRRGFLNEAELERAVETFSTLNALPIWIDDSSALTPIELKAKARVRAHKDGVDMIIVDYMQLMEDSRKAENRTQEMTRISRSIKALARELDVPVLALSQLNRNAEARESQEPRLGDLRESGAIEQDADVVILLHRPRMREGNAVGDAVTGQTRAIVAKQRNGRCGVAPLWFRADFLQFVDGEVE